MNEPWVYEQMPVNSGNLPLPCHPVSLVNLLENDVTITSSFPGTFSSAPQHHQKPDPNLHVQAAVLSAPPPTPAAITSLWPLFHYLSLSSFLSSSPWQEGRGNYKINNIILKINLPDRIRLLKSAEL